MTCTCDQGYPCYIHVLPERGCTCATIETIRSRMGPSCERCFSASEPVAWWSRFPRGPRGTQSGAACAECDDFLRSQSYGHHVLGSDPQTVDVAARVQAHLARHQNDPRVAEDIRASYADLLEDEVFLWSDAWQAGDRETRAAFARGEGQTYATARDVIRELQIFPGRLDAFIWGALFGTCLIGIAAILGRIVWQIVG